MRVLVSYFKIIHSGREDSFQTALVYFPASIFIFPHSIAVINTFFEPGSSFLWHRLLRRTLVHLFFFEL